jgi:hypothetical protein
MWARDVSNFLARRLRAYRAADWPRGHNVVLPDARFVGGASFRPNEASVGIPRGCATAAAHLSARHRGPAPQKAHPRHGMR